MNPLNLLTRSLAALNLLNHHNIPLPLPNRSALTLSERQRRKNGRGLWGVGLLLLISLTAYAYDGEVQQRHDAILATITGAPSQQPDAMAQPCRSITSFGAKSGGTADCLPAFRKAMKQASRS